MPMLQSRGRSVVTVMTFLGFPGAAGSKVLEVLTSFPNCRTWLSGQSRYQFRDIIIIKADLWSTVTVRWPFKAQRWRFEMSLSQIYTRSQRPFGQSTQHFHFIANDISQNLFLIEVFNKVHKLHDNFRRFVRSVTFFSSSIINTNTTNLFQSENLSSLDCWNANLFLFLSVPSLI